MSQRTDDFNDELQDATVLIDEDQMAITGKECKQHSNHKRNTPSKCEIH